MQRKGSLLEKDIERILTLAGFQPKLNILINGYEIDIFLNYNNQKIAIECKQYEKSSLHVRNLIHQWDSKNKELKFDKIVLALIGSEITSKEYHLANKYDITILDENQISSLLDEAIDKREKIKDKLLRLFGIDFKADTISSEQESYEETEHQILIADKLKEFFKRGTPGAKADIVGNSSFIIKERGTDLQLNFGLEPNGLDSFIYESDTRFKKIEDFLLKNGFNKVDRIVSYNQLIFLEEKEFANGCHPISLLQLGWKSVQNVSEGILIQFGKNINFISGIIDKLLREVYGVSDESILSIKLNIN